MRPPGAIFFGRIGDLIGRKYAFLVTLLIMGGATTLVGLLPTYEQIGIAAPIILVLLRLLQGLALGGEYGGAATYVARHAPDDKRGYYTSFIQTTATLFSLPSVWCGVSDPVDSGRPRFQIMGLARPVFTFRCASRFVLLYSAMASLVATF